jgi:ATP-dependent Lon protease
VLPIGGLKEKLLAAHRGGIRTVVIPFENEKDLTEIPENVKANLTVKCVRWIDEVLEIALQKMPIPIVVESTANVDASASKADAKTQAVVAH